MSRPSVIRQATLALALLSLSVLSAYGITIKGDKEYNEYDKIVLKASGELKEASYLWDVSGSAQVEEVGGTLYVWARPGSYSVTLTAIDFSAKKVERTRFNFTVKGTEPLPPPEPPGPGPGPGPQPPPLPVSDLKKLLQDAVNKDQDKNKAQILPKIAAVFKVAADQESVDTKYETFGQLDEVIRATMLERLGTDRLALFNLRDEIASWLSKRLPSDSSAKMDDQLRQKCKSAYTAVADAVASLSVTSSKKGDK